jgi:hypothetical protein
MNFFSTLKKNNKYFIINESTQKNILNFHGKSEICHTNKSFLDFIIADLENCSNTELKDGYINTQEFCAYRIFSTQIHGTENSEYHNYYPHAIYEDGLWVSELMDPDSENIKHRKSNSVTKALISKYGEEEVHKLFQYGMARIYHNNPLRGNLDENENPFNFIDIKKYKELKIVKNIINDIKTLTDEQRACLITLHATFQSFGMSSIIIPLYLVNQIIRKEEFVSSMMSLREDLIDHIPNEKGLINLDELNETQQMVRQSLTLASTTVEDYLKFFESESVDRIMSKIINHETTTVELKSSFFKCQKTNNVLKEIRHECLKTIAGFMNSKGGTLIIGVRDDLEIIGLEKDKISNKIPKVLIENEDEYTRLINRYVMDCLGKEVSNKISFVYETIQNKRVCEISVERVNGGVFCVDTHFNKIKKYPDKDPIFYLRRDRETIILNSQETHEYLNRIQGIDKKLN